jgi:sphingosine-1-phosphate phosphatase 1
VPSGKDTAHTITNHVLHYYFFACAALGNELFYIIAFPALIWLSDATVGRRSALVWGLIYYVGQSMKDLLELPRPPSPPVAQLEKHYAAEYGFPSTHAMVSLALPLYTVSAYATSTTGGGYNFDVTIALAACAVWCTSICLSRLYVGVHTVCDLLGGLFFGSLVLGAGLLCGESVDTFLRANAAVAPFAAIGISFLAIWSYPAPKAWTNAYGDTSLIIAAVSGIVCGQCALDVYTGGAAAVADAAAADASGIVPPTLSIIILQKFARMLIGSTLIFLTRSSAKSIAQRVWVSAMLPRYTNYLELLQETTHKVTASEYDSVANAETKQTRNGSKKVALRNRGVAPAAPTVEILAAGVTTAPAAVTPVASPRTQQQRNAKNRLSSATRGSMLSPKPDLGSVVQAALLQPPQQFRLSVPTSQRTMPTIKDASSQRRTTSPFGALLQSPLTGESIGAPGVDEDTTPAPAYPLVCLRVRGHRILINPFHVYIIEVPIKYATYFSVGFNACATIPIIFHLLGI